VGGVVVARGVVLEQPAKAKAIVAAAAEMSNLGVMVDHPREGVWGVILWFSGKGDVGQTVRFPA
jgi:hypothetical protein